MSTELTVKTPISTILQGIREKIESMEKIQDSPWVTSGKIQMAGGAIDLKTNVGTLDVVKAYGSILSRHKSVEDAYTDLDIKTYPVIKVDGNTKDEWKKDIQLKLAIINQDEDLKELNAIKKDLEDLMDKDDKKTLVLERVKKFAGVTAE